MPIQYPAWLIPAYVANILILLPVCYSMFFGNGVASVFEGKVAESEGLRLLAGSLWLAILIASAAGLAAPAMFAPVLLIQIVYKSVWLLAFVLPLITAGKPFPVGIAAVFLLIVIVYPVLYLLSVRS